MAPWIKAVETCDTIRQACDRVEVSLAAFQRARLADPEFDDACRIYDQIADLKITESLRIKALEGNVAAMNLYFRRVRVLVFGPDEPGHAPAGNIFSPVVAAIMLRASLDQLESPPGDGPIPDPSPSSSRPEAPRSCKSKKTRDAGKSGPSS